MRLLIRMSRCTHGGHLHRLKPQPVLLWLDHRRTLSPALRRKRQPTGVRCSAPLTPALRLSSPGPFMSVLPCISPLRGLSSVCSLHTSSPADRARTVSHTPVAFKSSSAASTPTPSGSVKTQTDPERDRTPTSVPMQDVKRILKLAYPERGRLAGKLVYQHTDPLSPPSFCIPAPTTLNRFIQTHSSPPEGPVCSINRKKAIKILNVYW